MHRCPHAHPHALSQTFNTHTHTHTTHTPTHTDSTSTQAEKHTHMHRYERTRRALCTGNKVGLLCVLFSVYIYAFLIHYISYRGTACGGTFLILCVPAQLQERECVSYLCQDCVILMSYLSSYLCVSTSMHACVHVCACVCVCEARHGKKGRARELYKVS